MRLLNLNAHKGVKGGTCNRTRCDNKCAFWFNTSTQKFYCQPCSFAIQSVNPTGLMVSELATTSCVICKNPYQNCFCR